MRPILTDEPPVVLAASDHDTRTAGLASAHDGFAPLPGLGGRPLRCSPAAHLHQKFSSRAIASCRVNVAISVSPRRSLSPVRAAWRPPGG